MKDAAAKLISPDMATSTTRASSHEQDAWHARRPRSFMEPRPPDARQTAGNFAVQRLLRTGAIQAKLNVSHPGDFYEREADRVAEEVLSAPVPQPGPPVVQAGHAEPGSLQRKCACEEEGSAGACDTCREKQLNIQRRPASSAGEGVSKGQHGLKGGASVHEVVRSAGRPLDSAARAFFEPRFGRDLSSVRIHSDASAGASAKSVNALAYTLGRDIVFGQGQYDSGSQEGRRLLAHELAHVIQQDFGSGLSDAVVQRDPDPQGQPAPEAPSDPSAPIPLPPEHEERVARLEEMAKDIEQGEQSREELQAQVRSNNEIVGPPTEEEQAAREDVKAQLTWREENLASMIEERIRLIDDSVTALQQLLPGVTPSPPKEPTASGEPAPDASVQSEISRLSQERFKEASRLTLLKRCLARKKIRQIDAKLAALPTGPSLEAIELEDEKKQQLDFLKSSASGISCVKPPGQARHPTEVSDPAVEKMKRGEGMIPIPYVAGEGEGKGSGGCTIGYGHVITEKGDKRTCKHAEGPEPVKKFVPIGEKVELGPHLFRVGTLILRKCICTPDWVVSKTEALKLAKDDMGGAVKWVKEHVHVDLDQEQFDALVDITLAVGSIPQSLLDVIHSKICVDDEAVRQEYMKTALFTKDHPEKGPVHAPRRKERVWGPKGPKGDEDPTCV